MDTLEKKSSLKKTLSYLNHLPNFCYLTPILLSLGSDIPEKSESNMYPQDKVVPVGSNMTFCCIVKEKVVFKDIMYMGQQMSTTRLSRRTYAITVTNQPASGNTGTNVVCCSPDLTLTGAVVFVGCEYNSYQFISKYILC